MNLISYLSTYVLVIVIKKSQKKIKPTKWCFLHFNLKGSSLTEGLQVSLRGTQKGGIGLKQINYK